MKLSYLPSHRLFSFVFPLVLGLIILILSVIGIFQSIDSGNIVFSGLSALSYISLTIFGLVCLLGLYSNKLYFTFLIFVLLAFPAPVNDFFPGVFLGNQFEYGASIFPFFTHIDIYLLLGIFKSLFTNNKISIKSSLLFQSMIFCIFLSILANYFNPQFLNHDFLLLIQGLFQFRYLIEIYLLLSLFDISQFKNNIVFSFIISIVFLFIESIIYTLKTHSPALMSGSLANNTFASIVASILLFMILINKRYTHSKLIRYSIMLLMLVSVLIILLSGARMAILAFLVTYTIFLFLDRKLKLNFNIKIKWIVLFLVAAVGIRVASNYLPPRYNPKNLTEKISFGQPSMDLTQFIRIERSWETNSLITRMELYSASLKMLQENPLTGVGVGRWNSLKQKFGFKEFLLIDSHNGYLSVLSQYGLLGIPLILFIYFFPASVLYKSLKSQAPSNFLIYLGVINLYIAFADLSNSGIFKHQIFALLAFNSICLLKIFSRSKKVELTGDSPKNH